jgi:hypothetical protein
MDVHLEPEPTEDLAFDQILRNDAPAAVGDAAFLLLLTIDIRAA